MRLQKTVWPAWATRQLKVNSRRRQTRSLLTSKDNWEHPYLQQTPHLFCCFPPKDVKNAGYAAFMLTLSSGLLTGVRCQFAGSVETSKVTQKIKDPLSQMTVLPRQQEHAHSAHVYSNRSIFGFTLNLFILIIQHAVTFRTAVQRSTWLTAVLNPSKSMGLAGYEPLLCVQKSPVQNNWSVNYCLRENQCTAGRRLKGALSETPRGTL